MTTPTIHLGGPFHGLWTTRTWACDDDYDLEPGDDDVWRFVHRGDE